MKQLNRSLLNCFGVNLSRRYFLSKLAVLGLFFASPSAIANEMSLLDKILGPKKGGASYHFRRGYQALIEFGDTQGAITEFTKAIALDSTIIEAYFNRGLVYYRISQFELAVKDFEQTLKLDPNHSYAPFWQVSVSSRRRHEQLEKLFTFPQEDRVSVSPSRAAPLLKKCISTSSRLDRYRSILVVRDTRCIELKEGKYEIIRWDADYISPSSFSLFQLTRLEDFPHGAGYYWVTLGQDKYYFVPPFPASVKTHRTTYNDQIETFLKMDKYLQILEVQDVEHFEISKVDNQQWYLFETELEPNTVLGGWRIAEIRRQLARSLYHVFGEISGDEIKLFEIPVVSDQAPPKSIAKNADLDIVQNNFMCTLKIWVDASNYYVAKAQIELTGNLENGEPISMTLEQVFSDCNGDIQIMAPPS